MIPDWAFGILDVYVATFGANVQSHESPFYLLCLHPRASFLLKVARSFHEYRVLDF